VLEIGSELVMSDDWDEEESTSSTPLAFHGGASSGGGWNDNPPGLDDEEDGVVPKFKSMTFTAKGGGRGFGGRRSEIVNGVRWMC
jgi:hypothetical protein